MITVRKLKELIADWPEENAAGEPCEVWIETGRNLTSGVQRVEKLNVRESDGVTACDLLLESDAFIDVEPPAHEYSTMDDEFAKYLRALFQAKPEDQA